MSTLDAIKQSIAEDEIREKVEKEKQDTEVRNFIEKHDLQKASPYSNPFIIVLFVMITLVLIYVVYYYFMAFKINGTWENGMDKIKIDVGFFGGTMTTPNGAQREGVFIHGTFLSSDYEEMATMKDDKLMYRGKTFSKSL